MQRHRVAWLLPAILASAAALAAPSVLSAQGFGLNEIGSCAIARAFATTAAPCRDASTIYWNSAAATSLTGWNVAVGAASIGIKGSFTQDTTRQRWDSDAPTQVVPHVFVNYHAPTSALAWGVGVYVPYGLTSEWGTDFPGRFEAQKAALSTIYVQPNVAWQINPKWSIGGGPIVAHSSVELVQALDLSQQLTGATPGAPTFGQLGIAPGTEFAQVDVKGSATGYGAQIAFQAHPNPQWTFGGRFLTPITFKYNGAKATFAQVPTNLVVGGTLAAPFTAGIPVDVLLAPQFQAGGALVSQTASTKITHPAQIQVGAAYSGFTNWLVEADYALIAYKSFDNLPFIFHGPASAASQTLIEDYNNSSAIRLGAEYTVPSNGWKLRAGFAGAASAAPPETVTPLLPEQDREYGTLGAGVPFLTRYALDVSYAHVLTAGARGRIVERSNLLNTNLTADQLNSGVFNLSANILSVTLKANF